MPKVVEKILQISPNTTINATELHRNTSVEQYAKCQNWWRKEPKYHQISPNMHQIITRK